MSTASMGPYKRHSRQEGFCQWRIADALALTLKRRPQRFLRRCRLVSLDQKFSTFQQSDEDA